MKTRELPARPTLSWGYVPPASRARTSRRMWQGAARFFRAMGEPDDAAALLQTARKYRFR